MLYIKARLSNDSSVTVESGVTDQEIDETIHSPKPGLLSQKTRRNYDEFIKFIDFTIINQPSRVSTSSRTAIDQSKMEEMLALFRNSRALKRAAEEV